MRVGTADARFNTFDQYVGAALTVTQPFAGRADDAIGIAMARGHVGSAYRFAQSLSGAPTHSTETSIELTYRLAAAQWLTLAPSIQYVNNPGADFMRGNAWIVGLRFELTKEHAWPMTAQVMAPASQTVAQAEESQTSHR